MTKSSDYTLASLLEEKVVITDTSSLLIAGTHLLDYLSSCELIVPAVVVQELEKKRTHPTLGILARQWINFLEELRLSHGVGLAKGALVKNNITVRVEPNHTAQKSLPKHLRNGTIDSTILSVAMNFSTEVPKPVVLLSNDTPMRLHATLELSLEAYEFTATQKDEKPYTGHLYAEVAPEDLNGFADNPQSMAELFPSPLPEYGLVHLSSEGELAYEYILAHGKFSSAPRKIKASGIVGRTVEQDVALDYLRRHPSELPIVSIGGSAGTGKTLLTMATAIELLKDNLHYDCYQKIVVFRSLHEMGQGQELGFLPGGVNEKMEAWAGAISDAFDVIASVRRPVKKNDGPAASQNRKEIADKLRASVEVSPITYLRGRSLSNSFIVLDEAQNFSRTELLNIISRVGENSKLVLLWDSAQVDNRFLKAGKDADIWSVVNSFKNEDIFAHITLTRTERSRIAELASRMLEN